ncbi:hypothetical protein MNBD_GAMMA22-100 [hydrothermal vent metagenome]|uniref:Pyrrolo-quinoline quinone repeat domain-containing protein n=1 Tax=hydrothermal vent metagenome TaxID=652676 RepID=A0A3B1B1W1_9ZZZZ
MKNITLAFRTSLIITAVFWLWLTSFNDVMAITNGYYPRNPCYMKQHIYVGEAGLKKFNLTPQTKIWSVLQNHTTFEPVCVDQYILIGSHDGLYAINSSTGIVHWSVGKGAVLYSPVVINGFVYVSSQDGKIQKLQLDSGKLVWEKQLNNWLYPPVVTGNRIIVGGGNSKLYAFDTKTGKLLWLRHIGQELVYRPIEAKTNIVIITTYGSEVIALNVKTNRIIWSIKNTSAAYTPVVNNEQLFYGDQNGIIRAVNLETGNENWHTQLNGVIRSIPAIDFTHSNTVWIGTERGQLTALNKTNGSIQWQKQLTESIVHSPLPIKNRVYLKIESKDLMFESFLIPKTLQKNTINK